MSNIAQKVLELEEIHLSESPTKLGKYVKYSLYKTTETIRAYTNATHQSGDDFFNGDKPFADIVTQAVQTRYRATDIDRKMIDIKAGRNGKVIPAMLLNIVLKEWMRKENFGIFLNKWGMELSKYGSSVVKSTRKGGELHIDVVPWNRLIVDPEDMEQAPVIEFYNLTESDLLKNNIYDKYRVQELISAKTARETKGKEIVDQNKDFYKIYEVHGLLQESELTDNEDDTDFVQQVHIISYQIGEDGKKAPYTLYRGKEEESPYMITHLVPEEGRTLSRGVVEQLFNAQWMTNHYATILKDSIDTSSKMVYQTEDDSLQGRNSMELETGSILHVKKPVTPLNNQVVNTVPIQNGFESWKGLSNHISGVSEPMMGDVKAGAAWRQTEAILQEAHSLFALMVQNKSLYLEKIIKKYVIPYLKDKLNTKEEISAVLDSQMIETIDKMFIPAEAVRRANKKAAEQFLKNADKMSIEEMQAMQPLDIAGEERELQQGLAKLGGQRFFKPSEMDDTTWKELFKDIDEQVIINIAGEEVNTQQNVETLKTVLQTLASNPTITQDKKTMLILSKILESTGTISPIEISTLQEESQMPVNQQQQFMPVTPK